MSSQFSCTQLSVEVAASNPKTRSKGGVSVEGPWLAWTRRAPCAAEWRQDGESRGHKGLQLLAQPASRLRHREGAMPCYVNTCTRLRGRPGSSLKYRTTYTLLLEWEALVNLGHPVDWVWVLRWQGQLKHFLQAPASTLLWLWCPWKGAHDMPTRAETLLSTTIMSVEASEK
jgi:hypothetical protein